MFKTKTVFQVSKSEKVMSKRPGILGRLWPGSGKTEEELNPQNLVSDDGKNVPLEEGKVKLKREVGLFSAIFLIVGNMTGSGIFISPKGVLVNSGPVWMSLIVWLWCGFISYLGALCYAELGTAIPVSGGDYSYYLHAYGKKCKLGSILAFLYFWMCSIIIKTSIVAMMLMTFAEYAVEPISWISPVPPVSKKLVALSAICFITFINCFSVKLATIMINVCTVKKLLAIVMIVSVGIYRLFLGHYIQLEMDFDRTTSWPSHLGIAFYMGIWAYDGCNNLNFIAEELINPTVNLPRAIAIGIPLVTMCYVLINISYLTVLSSSELLQSEVVAVSFANKILGPVAFIMPIIVAASAFGAASGTCLIASRLPFVAAREGHLPELMSHVQVNRLTPTPALVFNGLIVFIMIAVGNFENLINFFSFAQWMFYCGTMLTVIVLRFTEKDLERPFKVNIIIPAVMVIVASYVVLLPIIRYPALEYLYVLLFLFSGLCIYIPFVYFEVRLKFMEKLTHLMQIIFNCVPAE